MVGGRARRRAMVMPLAAACAALAVLLGITVGRTGVAVASSHVGSERVVLDHGSVDAVYPAGDGRLYVALAQGTSGREVIALIDEADGRTLARRTLGAALSGVVRVQGSVWAVSASVSRRATAETLWRLDPDTLSVRSRRRLPGTEAGITEQPIAATGRRIWIADGNRLIQIDPATGDMLRDLRIARARELGVIGDPADRYLILSAGDGDGLGWIQERDPVTGAFRATTGRYEGVALPRLGGIAGDSLWLTEATGLEGYAQRVSLATLRPLPIPAPLRRPATNGIQANVVGGELFVTDPGGGAALNYCAGAVTGAERAALPAALRLRPLEAVGGDQLLFPGASTRRDPSGPLIAAPVPAACR